MVSTLSLRFRLFFTMFEAERLVSGFQDFVVVSDAVEQGCDHLGIAENPDRFTERQVGGDDQ